MTTKRTAPAAMDTLRVRALRGDRLADLSDAQREWVWRSLLKDVRRAETMALGQISDEQYVRGVTRVRRWYEQRLAAYKALPKVVRPVKPLVKSQRRGFWMLGKGGV
jgi:hypothetical protein